MPEIEVRKYVVRLSAEERRTLEAIIHKGTHPSAQVLKAQILLKADVSEAGEGWNDKRIVAAFDTSLTTVHRTRQRLVEEGFDAVLQRKQRERPSIARIFDGEKEARLITLACSEPPPGHARWSLRLLEEKVVELGIVARASDNTIGRTLKKTFSNRTSGNSGSFRQRPTRLSWRRWKISWRSTHGRAIRTGRWSAWMRPRNN
jgi:hypothetical protein